MKTFTYTTRCKTILGDLHTPVSTYLKVRDIFPQSALMESSDYHGSENNRSFIGLNPVASIGINHGTATATYPDGSMEEHPISEHFRADHAISDFLNRFKVSGEYNNYCGLYGYTTFNAVRYFEHINVKDSRDPKNDAPDMLYILYKYLIVFNDFRNEMLLLEMLQDATYIITEYFEKNLDKFDLNRDEISILIKYYKCLFIGILMGWLNNALEDDLGVEMRQAVELMSRHPELTSILNKTS